MTVALTGGSMLSILMQKMGFTGEVTDVFILRNSIDARTAEPFQQRDSSVWLLRPSQKGLLGNPSCSPPHQPAQHPCPPAPRVLDCSHSAQFQTAQQWTCTPPPQVPGSGLLQMLLSAESNHGCFSELSLRSTLLFRLLLSLGKQAPFDGSGILCPVHSGHSALFTGQSVPVRAKSCPWL